MRGINYFLPLFCLDSSRCSGRERGAKSATQANRSRQFSARKTYSLVFWGGGGEAKNDYFLKKFFPGVCEQIFYFFHFQLLTDLPDADNPVHCRPVELGIVQYSLKSGVKDTFHRFIHPGGEKEKEFLF